jgi:hypothetical protein
MTGSSPDSAIATPSFVDHFRPPLARSTHQVADIGWPSPGATNCNAIVVAGLAGRQSSIAYQVYVEGLPHPSSRQSFYKRNRAQERSKPSYYVILYGHKAGIYYTWPGCQVHTCNFPGANYVSIRRYAKALYQLWPPDAYRLPAVEPHIQPEHGHYTPPIISDPICQLPRYSHPYKACSWRSSIAMDTMAELFPMAQVAHVRPDAMPSSRSSLHLPPALTVHYMWSVLPIPNTLFGPDLLHPWAKQLSASRLPGPNHASLPTASWPKCAPRWRPTASNKPPATTTRPTTKLHGKAHTVP